MTASPLLRNGKPGGIDRGLHPSTSTPICRETAAKPEQTVSADPSRDPFPRRGRSSGRDAATKGIFDFIGRNGEILTAARRCTARGGDF
jgi:hypothetical protein